MSDQPKQDSYADLIARLRERHLAWEGAEQYGSLDEDAADALEAQALRIAELERELSARPVVAFLSDIARIAALEAALDGCVKYFALNKTTGPVVVAARAVLEKTPKDWSHKNDGWR